MGPFSFFLLVIATFTLSSAALLLDWMVTERNPNGRRPLPMARTLPLPGET